jgi:hypothetical protein
LEEGEVKKEKRKKEEIQKYAGLKTITLKHEHLSALRQFEPVFTFDVSCTRVLRLSFLKTSRDALTFIDTV